MPPQIAIGRLGLLLEFRIAVPVLINRLVKTLSASDLEVISHTAHDDFPIETVFGMWDAGSAPTGAAYFADPDLVFATSIPYDVGASSPIGFGDGFVLPGDFSGEPANVPFTFIWDLGAGDYTFILLDTFGDGICCGFGEGNYSLTVDGNEVGAGGEFLEFEVTQFTIDNGGPTGPTGAPEPGILVLLSVGLLGFGLSRLRK